MTKATTATLLAVCAALTACDNTSTRDVTAPNPGSARLAAVGTSNRSVIRPDGSVSLMPGTQAKVLRNVGVAASGTTQCDLGVILPPDEEDKIFPAGGLAGGTYDNIEVPPDKICVLDGVVVTNNVRAFAGSRLFVYSSEIGGNIEGLSARVVQVNSETTVGGNVDVRNAGELVYPFVSCAVENTTIRGNLSCTGGNPASVVIRGQEEDLGNEGGPAVPLPIGGSVILERNVLPPGSVLILHLTHIGNNADVSKNTGGGSKSVDNNTVVKTLECKKNDLPFVGGPNVANKTKGQCF